MFVYFFAILLVLIWKIGGYFEFNEPINLSTTSTPLIQTSINIAFKSQGEAILKTEVKKCSTFFLLQPKFSIIYGEILSNSTDPM